MHPDQIVLTLADPSPTAERIIALPFQGNRRPQRTIHPAIPSPQPGQDRLIRSIARAHAGHLPRTISATDIARTLPLAWADQRKMLGV